MDSSSDSDSEEKEPDQRWGNKERNGVSSSVILVDVSSSDQQLSVSISVTLSLLRHMLINSPSHLIGMALYATKVNEGRDLENVVQIFELKQPSIEEVLMLKKYSSDIQHVRKTWGVAGDYNFEHALSQAFRMFSQCKKKKTAQTVTILSHFSEPDPSNHQTILNRASALISYDIDIKLINVSEQSLLDNSFYEQLGLLISKDSKVEWEPLAPLMSVEDILPLIWQNTHTKAAPAKLKFHLSDDVILGVGLYYLCKSKSLPKKLYFSRKTNERVNFPVLATERWSQTARPILKPEVCMYQQYGNRNIELTEGEFKQLKNFGGAPCIKLLGFKPSSILSMKNMFLKSCTFLYPEEDILTGSTQLFQCLRDRCIAKNRIAICLIIFRLNAYPRLIALVPQKQIIKKGHLTQPDGFYVIYLPYLNNMKKLYLEKVNPCKVISEEQLKCMHKIMEKLNINYSFDTFENPKLQTFYKAIEALALGEKKPEPCKDTTQPDLSKHEAEISDFIEDFNNLFGPFGVPSVKRKLSGESGAKSKKKSKEPVECPDIGILSDRISLNEVEKYTVEDLKKILKWRDAYQSYGFTLTRMKKAQLVHLVYEHCKDI